MQSLEQQLDEIETLVAKIRINEAEDKLRGLLFAVGIDELKVWEPDILKTIERFHHKRKKALLQELEHRLHPVSTSTSQPAASVPPFSAERFRSELHERLKTLSEYHIFQWPTFYRDLVSQIYLRFIQSLHSLDDVHAAANIAQEEFELHSFEIYTKGYQYLSEQTRTPLTRAVSKSLSGLQRFLDLPIELYSASASGFPSKQKGLTLRYLTSSLLGGILCGYSRVNFGGEPGASVLSRHHAFWAHYLGFLTAGSFAQLVRELQSSFSTEAYTQGLIPFLGSIDDIVSKCTDDSPPLPVIGQYFSDLRRLDISLRCPALGDARGLVELQCYLDSTFTSRHLLSEAAGRDVAVVVIYPNRPDLQEWITSHQALREKVCSVKHTQTPQSVRKQIFDMLEYALYKRRSPRARSAPLAYNFAREFPLHNPFLTKYYYVYRSSVRALLKTFEHRNGVRLWCSIRRSGKTTACFDLGTTDGRSVVVTQTCDNTEQIPGANVFYELVCDALSSNHQVHKSFFQEAVQRCADVSGSSGDRHVFVLDEYETFFGRLRLAVRRNPELRYLVAQPLMNQMVAFAKDNLLVFIGQQPDAHFFLMDQNQLSSYVQQDTFPLFEHHSGDDSGEFTELLTRVLTDRVTFEAHFADEVYRQTSGHPFLTVKLLVCFVEWLIERKRPVGDLRLRAEDFNAFTKDKVTVQELSLNYEYVFFREAISEAISVSGKKESPWLYAVYRALRGLALEYPSTLSCTRSEFAWLITELGLAETGFTSDYVLSTGTQSNFLAYDDARVWARIPLLARLAGVSRERTLF
jgi:hypothetical protein